MFVKSFTIFIRQYKSKFNVKDNNRLVQCWIEIFFHSVKSKSYID